MRRSLVVCLMGAAISCGGGSSKPGGSGGSGGGMAGAPATGGNSGNAGGGGATAGTGGAAGVTGMGGTAGVGGSGGTGGTAGSPGTGGTAGTIGSGGTAGTAGMGGGPACIPAGHGDVVEFAIVGSDGMPVKAPVTATVMVTSIDSCAQVTCPSFLSYVSSGMITPASSRLVLTAPGPQWTLYLRDSAMPSNLIQVGDTFDLTINAGPDSTFYQQSVDQTMVLSRGGNLIFFAAGLDRSFKLSTPALDAFGVQVSDAGTFACQSSPFGPCTGGPHAAQVAVGSDNATLGGGQTSTIGWLTFTNASFTEWDDSSGGCDAMSATIMAGFRSP